MPRTLTQLQVDPVVQQLPQQLVTWFIQNADHVKFALDIDGTLTGPGQKISPSAIAILNRLKAYTVLITAQAAGYVDNNIGLKDYPNLVSEKGVVIRIDGKEEAEPAPAEVPGFTSAMATLLGGLDSHFIFNKKTAGYAVGFENGDFTAADLAQVEALMKEQAENSGGKYVFEATAGFFDITLAHLSKATALKKVAASYPGASRWVAMGDSRNTDGVMLDEATNMGGKGIMVANPYGNYPVFPSFVDVIDFLKWFDEVQGAPDRR